MNDDQPTQRLIALKTEHRALDEEILARVAEGEGDMLALARLKKRKLFLKDEIQRLVDQNTPDIIA